MRRTFQIGVRVNAAGQPTHCGPEKIRPSVIGDTQSQIPVSWYSVVSPNARVTEPGSTRNIAPMPPQHAMLPEYWHGDV